MDTEQILESETAKWLERLEQRMASSRASEKKVHDQVVNIKAYISDSKHFLKKGDLVRAFEAVIYAYGIFETCINLGLLKEGGGKK